MLGGLLVGYFGLSVPLYLDAATFALVATLPFLLDLPTRRPAATSSTQGDKGAFEGFRLMLTTPMIRSLTVMAVHLRRRFGGRRRR
jgi:hypothetical protein